MCWCWCSTPVYVCVCSQKLACVRVAFLWGVGGCARMRVCACVCAHTKDGLSQKGIPIMGRALLPMDYLQGEASTCLPIFIMRTL